MLNGLDTFDPFSIESEVRSYCRNMPAIFKRAENSEVWDEHGVRYIDFLCGCGAVNYGHNNPQMKAKLIEYISSNGITTSLDLHTVAKRNFLASFQQNILTPRHLSYRVQFPGPTGTNAVEAAFKIARKATNRSTIVCFSNGFHGMTLGALAATSNARAREGAGVQLRNIHRLPFQGDGGATVEELLQYEQSVLGGTSSPPAAFVVETVQGEGGLNVASTAWLQALASVASRLGAMLIVDDIQAGCGRTGSFFSFDGLGVVPDIVCLSKSIGGFGLPLALVLIKPEIDLWRPGEHNGTFRGNNLAFVTAAAALEYWRDDQFSKQIESRARIVQRWIERLSSDASGQISPRGRGLMQGFLLPDQHAARQVAQRAFQNGVLLECCGPAGNVVKIMPPLTIPESILVEGLQRLQIAVQETMHNVMPWAA